MTADLDMSDRPTDIATENADNAPQDVSLDIPHDRRMPALPWTTGASPSLTLLPTDDTGPLGHCIAALSGTGWSMTPVVDWLFGPGSRVTTLPDLLRGLGEVLIAAGAPVLRLRLGIWAIHPQQEANAYTWMRGQAEATTLNVGYGIFQTPDYLGSPTEMMHRSGSIVRYRLDRLDPVHDHDVLFNLREMGGTDYIGIPMPTFTGRQDSFFVVTDRTEGFTDTDIAKFRMLARMLLPVVESLAQHQLSVNVLNTYLGERTGQRVLAGKIRRGDGERIKAALWYSDLRDFTAMSETVEETAMLDLMNAYFAHVFESVTVYGGEVLRFIGDAMLIVFPTGDGQDPGKACDNALNAASDAIYRLPALNARLRRQGLPAIAFGIGLHEGSVLYGNVGADARLDFTVMGPAVNRTSRIETLTKRLGTPVLMSKDFADLVSDRFPRTDFGAHPVAGIADPIQVFKPHFWS
ncbi:adenylate/guanylate cyclase domain-containing protein [Marivibrio halodurans]|uniref:Adenylate/guanylate cyclase domain-containing protein n=1 Tax=Marivibrio halodurans TaxID=2039722 RepID=A0A8J7S4B0_9PROT|nr:adenylate/guanylate cyclase domain-containing protein [Marivibrio halodurans]MBP5855397.1 adenylate/guanylate cyclase domain-containing protein [Marivibrio halodurans]